MSLRCAALLVLGLVAFGFAPPLDLFALVGASPADLVGTLGTPIVAPRPPAPGDAPLAEGAYRVGGGTLQVTFCDAHAFSFRFAAEKLLPTEEALLAQLGIPPGRLAKLDAERGPGHTLWQPSSESLAADVSAPPQARRPGEGPLWPVWLLRVMASRSVRDAGGPGRGSSPANPQQAGWGEVVVEFSSPC